MGCLIYGSKPSLFPRIWLVEAVGTGASKSEFLEPILSFGEVPQTCGSYTPQIVLQLTQLDQAASPVVDGLECLHAELLASGRVEVHAQSHEIVCESLYTNTRR